MGRDVKIDCPIFIIGCHRSGSSIFYRMLASHPEVSWFSNFTELFPGLPFLAKFSNLFPLRQTLLGQTPLRALMPKPREGVRNFARNISVDKESLSLADIHPIDRSRLICQIAAHLKHHGRRRFLNKSVTNSYRVSYLNAIFPDAFFLHVVRDPRANIASLLNWNTPSGKRPAWVWKSLKEQWFSFVEDGHSSEDIMNLIRIPCKRWVETHHAIAKHRTLIGSRYMRVYYEELVGDTKKILSQVIEHCQLIYSDRYEQEFAKFHLQNMNSKYNHQFREEDLAFIDKLTIPVVKELAFPYVAL